jgi:hypothetical protein
MDLMTIMVQIYAFGMNFPDQPFRETGAIDYPLLAMI